MKKVRVFKVVQYWIDVDLEDDQDNEDALDISSNIDIGYWDYECTDSGILEEYHVLEN